MIQWIDIVMHHAKTKARTLHWFSFNFVKWSENLRIVWIIAIYLEDSHSLREKNVLHKNPGRKIRKPKYKD